MSEPMTTAIPKPPKWPAQTEGDRQSVITVWLPKAVHDALIIHSSNKRMSLNHLMCALVAKELSTTDLWPYFEELPTNGPDGQPKKRYHFGTILPTYNHSGRNEDNEAAHRDDQGEFH